MVEKMFEVWFRTQLSYWFKKYLFIMKKLKVSREREGTQPSRFSPSKIANRRATLTAEISWKIIFTYDVYMVYVINYVYLCLFKV